VWLCAVVVWCSGVVWWCVVVWCGCGGAVWWCVVWGCGGGEVLWWCGGGDVVVAVWCGTNLGADVSQIASLTFCTDL
jgi:hypothetical protein